MFTGLVEAHVPTLAHEPSGEGSRLVLPPPAIDGWEVALGDSVAVSGVCLTVAELDSEGRMTFHLSAETLQRSWFSELEPGRGVNVERALRLGDRLGGHMVSGHVDGLGTVVAVDDVGDGGREISFEVDPGLERYLVEKGSVTLDGISLTVVEPEDRRFRVAVIPVTLEVTSLGRAEPGRRVNVEADLVGKWIEKLVPGAG